MSAGFKAEYFTELAALEAGNFWFRVRNRIIIWALQKYTSDVSAILEIGCGTGFVTQAIAGAFPMARVTASEYFEDGLAYARQRVPVASFIQLDAREMPYEEEFDIIGAFDVLEHIEEDQQVLDLMYRSLTHGGVLLLTVPQHQWLWSIADEHACHARRYSAGMLHRKIEQAGFRLIRSTSFVTSLLPIMMLSRLAARPGPAGDYDPTAELRINPVINRLLEYMLMLDMVIIKCGIDLPVGGSRMVVAVKE